MAATVPTEKAGTSGEAVDVAELKKKAEEIAARQGNGASEAACTRCVEKGLECKESGGRKQKSCDACVAVKGRCLRPGEEKKERKRARKEKEEEAEFTDEPERKKKKKVNVTPAEDEWVE